MPPQDIKGLKVLVVDDNEVARMILQEILQSFDMAVTTVDSGAHGISLLQGAALATPFDLVILDWKISVMDGFELAKAICSDPLIGGSANLPKIIMVTMYDQDALFWKNMKRASEIDAYLHKPISSSELFNTIMELYGKKEAMVPRMSFTHKTGDIIGLEGIRGARVLLVEDNIVNQKVAVATLNRGGVIVDVAENGKEALKLIKKEPQYEAVLMDIEMPIMNGYSATRSIRRDPRFTDLPIIAMTAHALGGDKEKCLVAGMNDYVPKPVEERELFAVLIKWIKPGNRENPIPTETNREFPEEQWEQMPNTIAGIDVQTALMRLQGNSGLYRRLLRSYLEKFETVEDQLQRYLEAEDLQSIYQLTHAMRGVCSTIGANDLLQAVGDLDEVLKQGKKDALSTTLKTFQQKSSQLTSALKNLELDSSILPHDESSPDCSFEQTEKNFQQMMLLINERNARALTMLPELKKRIPHRHVANDLELLDQTLYNFDFTKAAAVLARIAEILNIDTKTMG